MIGVGLIGFGMAGQVFHAPLILRTPDLRLTAVATTRADQVAAIAPGARVCTAMELIHAPDIDLVVVATPNDVHAELGRLALQQGKAVVVDKPMTASLDSARRLADIARRSGRPFAVFHNRRWDDDFLTLRRTLSEGGLGPLVTFETRFDRYRPAVPDRWRDQEGEATGLWWDLGPHLVDQALQLMGRPDAVTADLARQRTGAVVDDHAHVILHYGARRAVLRAGCLVSSAPPRLTAECERGTFVTHGFDPQEARLKQGQDGPLPERWAPERWADVTLQTPEGPERRREPLLPGDYGAFYAAMAGAVRGQNDVPVSLESALAVMEVIERAEQSARQGRTLDISGD